MYPIFWWKRIPTAHNGKMYLSRTWFGRWQIHGHDGTEQGTPYMDGLWKKICRRASAAGVSPVRILVLGVAIGGTYTVLLRRWPNVRIVGVDWEPELLRLATELGAWKEDARVETIFGDALVEVPKLTGEFDLILVDLFNGKKVADAVRDPRLSEACARVLGRNGRLYLNYLYEKDVPAIWDVALERTEDIRYESNGVAGYRKRG